MDSIWGKQGCYAQLMDSYELEILNLKGTAYYISIRVRNKVNGIDYYTTFGVPEKIEIKN